MPITKNRRARGLRRAPANNARARGRARDYPEESPPRGGRGRFGQVRIKIGGNKIVIWNNAEGPLVIEPGTALVLQIQERWIKELDYARVIGYEAKVLNEAVAPKRSRIVEVEEEEEAPRERGARARREEEEEDAYNVGVDAKEWL